MPESRNWTKPAICKTLPEGVHKIESVFLYQNETSRHGFIIWMEKVSMRQWVIRNFKALLSVSLL
jgi:hypothetical protein